MPELPEMEAWRRALDDPVRAQPIERAGPAHIATLKTFDPPLKALDGKSLAGAERRGKRLLFPTADGELVLLVHLMTAGRLKFLRPGDKGPKTPAFRLQFVGGAELVLTEAGAKKRAGVWLLRPDAVAGELAHLGPEANEVTAAELGEILRSDSRRLHAALRDQRLVAGIGRAWANEILHAAKLSPYALTTQLSDEEVGRLHEAMLSELARGLDSARARHERRQDLSRSPATSASRATSAARRSRRSTSRSTRSSTARNARPRAASSRTGGCRSFCADADRARLRG